MGMVDNINALMTETGGHQHTTPGPRRCQRSQKHGRLEFGKLQRTGYQGIFILFDPVRLSFHHPGSSHGVADHMTQQGPLQLQEKGIAP